MIYWFQKENKIDNFNNRWGIIYLEILEWLLLLFLWLGLYTMHKILFLCLVLVLHNTSGQNQFGGRPQRPGFGIQPRQPSNLGEFEEDLAPSVDLGGITRTEFEEKLKQLKKELLDKIDEKIQAAMTNVGGLLGGLVSNRNSDIYRDYDY